MKTIELLDLDFRVKENRKKINDVLTKIVPRQSASGEVKLTAIEKKIKYITDRYDINFNYIMVSHSEDETIYSVSILKPSEGEWIKTVYGMCIYELLAKVLIFMVAAAKSKKVALKEDYENEEED